MDPVTGQRTKHEEIHMRYIRELVHDRTIILQYCPTDEQIADIFTKSFSEKKFTYLRSLLGVSSSGWSRLFSVFILRGGFFPLGFPSFPHLVCFEHCFSVSALYRGTYGLSCQGPSIFMHICFLTLPEYSLRGGVGDIYHHTHSFSQIGLVKPLS